MTWPTLFLAVPTSALTLGGEHLSLSPKATRQQLACYVTAIPAVYQRLAAGFTEYDFREMGKSPLSPDEQIIGDAYHHLYSPSGRDSRIEAEFRDGFGLVVTRGRHRMAMAQELAVPFLPVHVRALDMASLNRIGAQLESEIQQIAPEIIQPQRILNENHQRTRDDHRITVYSERARSNDIEHRIERRR